MLGGKQKCGDFRSGWMTWGRFIYFFSPGSTRLAARKGELNLNGILNQKARVLAGGAVWKQTGEARKDLLPEDNTLILNKKKRLFSQSEFNIDKLCKAQPLLMHAALSIKK